MWLDGRAMGCLMRGPRSTLHSICQAKAEPGQDQASWFRLDCLCQCVPLGLTENSVFFLQYFLKLF